MIWRVTPDHTWFLVKEWSTNHPIKNNQHSKLNQGSNSCSPWSYVFNTLNKLFFGRTGGYTLKPSILQSGQPECHAAWGKWTCLEQQVHKVYEHLLLLSCGLCEMGAHSTLILPNQWDDWGFFTKLLGGAKLRRCCNIIMNCNHDNIGPVDLFALMAEHHANIVLTSDVGSTSQQYLEHQTP